MIKTNAFFSMLLIFRSGNDGGGTTMAMTLDHTCANPHEGTVTRSRCCFTVFTAFTVFTVFTALFSLFPGTVLLFYCVRKHVAGGPGDVLPSLENTHEVS